MSAEFTLPRNQYHLTLRGTNTAYTRYLLHTRKLQAIKVAHNLPRFASYNTVGYGICVAYLGEQLVQMILADK